MVRVEPKWFSLKQGNACVQTFPFMIATGGGEAKGGGTDQVNYRENKSENHQERSFPRITSEEADQRNDV